MNTQHTGKHAEDLAKHYLEQRGLTCITRNYHCRYGEIDLIMRDNAAVVFVEVRYRSRSDYGGGKESVDYRKQRKLVRTATHYLKANHLLEHTARIDVIAFSSMDNRDESVEWIRNAVEG